MEKRIHARSSVSWPISFSGQELTGEGRLVNLSRGGCWARITKATEGLKPGMQVTVCFWLPDDPSPVTVAVAEVRWSMGREMGVKFPFRD